MDGFGAMGWVWTVAGGEGTQRKTSTVGLGPSLLGARPRCFDVHTARCSGGGRMQPRIAQECSRKFGNFGEMDVGQWKCDAIVGQAALDSTTTLSLPLGMSKERETASIGLERPREVELKVKLWRGKRGGKKRMGGNCRAKNGSCSGCSGAVVSAVLNTAIYGIVLWSPARDLTMLRVWLHFGGACVRSR